MTKTMVVCCSTLPSGRSRRQLSSNRLPASSLQSDTGLPGNHCNRSIGGTSFGITQPFTSCQGTCAQPNTAGISSSHCRNTAGHCNPHPLYVPSSTRRQLYPLCGQKPHPSVLPMRCMCRVGTGLFMMSMTPHYTHDGCAASCGQIHATSC